MLHTAPYFASFVPSPASPKEFGLASKLSSALALTNSVGGANVEERLKEERERTASERQKNGRNIVDTQMPLPFTQQLFSPAQVSF